MKLLEIRHLQKTFDRLQVIKDVSLTLDKGKVLAIMGPSGSGKSTLLRCATMLETIDCGEIIYNGRNLVSCKNAGMPVYAQGDELKSIRRMFGMVFQDYNLFPHFSVIRNITESPIRVLKQEPEVATKNAIRLMRMMGIEAKAASYPYQLSGGQRQRVSIARALALNPEILFFDEPTSALDPQLTGEIVKIIKDLTAENTSMVIVTHEINFARELADYVVFLDGGIIVEQGTPEQVLDNPRNERTKSFLGGLAHQP